MMNVRRASVSQLLIGLRETAENTCKHAQAGAIMGWDHGLSFLWQSCPMALLALVPLTCPLSPFTGLTPRVLSHERKLWSGGD